jgi:hypothetical protein
MEKRWVGHAIHETRKAYKMLARKLHSKRSRPGWKNNVKINIKNKK